jgi:hypothetical protein
MRRSINLTGDSTDEDVLQRYMQIVREGAVLPGLKAAKDTDLVELTKARILNIDIRTAPSAHSTRASTSVGVPEVSDIVGAIQPLGEVSKIGDSIWRVVRASRPDSSAEGTDTAAPEAAALVAHVKVYDIHPPLGTPHFAAPFLPLI